MPRNLFPKRGKEILNHFICFIHVEMHMAMPAVLKLYILRMIARPVASVAGDAFAVRGDGVGGHSRIALLVIASGLILVAPP